LMRSWKCSLEMPTSGRWNASGMFSLCNNHHLLIFFP
jgi:hypothetical protein